MFGNKQFFCKACPITKKSECGKALKNFMHDCGAPKVVTTDGSAKQMGKSAAFQQTLQKNNITSIHTQSHRPKHNPSKGVVRELRKKWCGAIFQTNCSCALWNCGLPHFAKLMQLTAANTGGLDGTTPLLALMGETPDMLQHLDFGWHDWAWHKENAGLDAPRLGRFLGTAHSTSNLMTFPILPESGVPVQVGMAQRVTKLKKQTEANKE